MKWLLLFLLCYANADLECRFACDDPVCSPKCEAKCDALNCSYVCQGEIPCPNEPICDIICQTENVTYSESCPLCEALCESPPISCPDCEIQCAQLSCGWDCTKPKVGPSCRPPTCELNCEQPACESSHSNKFHLFY